MSYLTSWIIRITFLGMLIVSSWYVNGRAFQLRQEVARQRIITEQHPLRVSQDAALQVVLEQRAFDIGRIQEMVVRREELVQVLARIEDEGSKRGIDINIPTVEEEMKIDGEGDPVQSSGPLEDIRIHIVGVGEPHELVEFLYAVEHLPYILDIPTWTVRTDRPVVQQGLVGIAPGGRSVKETQPGGLLEANVIISVMREGQ